MPRILIASLLWLLPGCAWGNGGGKTDNLRSIDEAVQALGAYVTSQFAAGGPGGIVLVARGERPVLRAAYGLADVEGGRSMAIEQPLPIGSVTKSFTAGTILALVQSGELALGDDVRRHVPEPPVGNRTLTIEQLLTHTSGMPNLVDAPDFFAWAQEPRSTAELLARTEGVPFHFEPGTGFYYTDSGYILLGAVLEQHHRGSWAAAIRDLVARPLGLDSIQAATQWGEQKAIGYSYDGAGMSIAETIDWSVPHASGALVATVDDLFGWVRAWRGGELATPHLRELAWAARTLPNGIRSGYGFGWKRCDFEGRAAIQHSGWVPGFTASVLHLPNEDLTAIALLNSEGKIEASYLTRRALRLLLTGAPEITPHVLIAEERADLLGHYRTDRGSNWILRQEDDGLVFDLAGERVELAAKSPTVLCAAESDGTWCFTFQDDRDEHAASVAASLTCEPQARASRVK
jgi:CubicO group peptidase (beta-lactamase class C family)